jgi:hypothetical protein
MTIHAIARVGRDVVRAALVASCLLVAAPITFAQANESEPNDSFGTANNLTLGGDSLARLGTSSDNDFFNVTLPTAGNLSITLKAQDISPSHGGQWRITLTRADSSVLWEYTVSPRDAGLVAPRSSVGLPAGTYRLHIRAASGCCDNPLNVPYLLRATLDTSATFEREGNDSVQAANPLALDASLVGQLGSGSDNDFYSFSTPAAGNLTVSLRAREAMPTLSDNWIVTLTDATTQTEFWSYVVSPREAGTQMRVGVPAGDFRVRVRAESACCSSPTFVPYVISANLTAGAQFESEPNGTAATATALPMDTDIVGELQSTSDADLFRVTLPQAGNLSLRLRAASATTADLAWLVTLQTSGGTTLDTWSASTSALAGATTLTGLAPGDYLVRITRENCCSQPTSIAYQVRASLTTGEFERESNNLSGSATAISLNREIQGHLAAADDSDFYKITLPQAATVVLTLRPLTAAGTSGTATWKAELTNTQGTVGSVETTNAALVGRSAVFQLPAGENFVRVARDCCGTVNRIPYLLSVRGASDDFDNDGIPNQVEVTEARNPNLRDNDIFANVRLFVMQMYRDFLTREGDAGGVTYWVGRINNRERSRAQMAEEYVNSQEFQGRVAPIVRASFAIDRAIPTLALTLARVAQRDGGRTIEQISQDIFLASPQRATYEAQAEAAFIASAYNDLLGRAPSASEQSTANQIIAASGRGGLLGRLANGDEYARRSYNQVYVTMMYMGMLRRAPEQGGFDFWVGVMNGGQSGLGLVQAFLDAPEYRGRFL